jgi:hypothetical protein
LKSLDLSNFDNFKVTDIDFMFYKWVHNTIDISNFDKINCYSY